jgi:hypothetical protein
MFFFICDLMSKSSISRGVSKIPQRIGDFEPRPKIKPDALNILSDCNAWVFNGLER